MSVLDVPRLTAADEATKEDCTEGTADCDTGDLQDGEWLRLRSCDD